MLNLLLRLRRCPSHPTRTSGRGRVWLVVSARRSAPQPLYQAQVASNYVSAPGNVLPGGETRAGATGKLGARWPYKRYLIGGAPLGNQSPHSKGEPASDRLTIPRRRGSP